MVSLFDWTNLNAYEAFYKIFNDIILHPNVKNPDLSLKAHLNILKTFAFNLYDVNCDNNVDEADVFSFTKGSKDDRFFQKVLLYDIKDIAKCLRKENEEIKRKDTVMEYDDQNNKRIKDLNGYLYQTSKKKADRKRAYEVFKPRSIKL